MAMVKQIVLKTIVPLRVFPYLRSSDFIKEVRWRFE